VVKKIEITPGRARKLNGRVKRLTGKNPAQAAAELAVMMRGYGLRKWAGRSLGAVDMQANTTVYVSDVIIEGSYWQGPSHDPRSRMSRYTAGERVISLYTPSYEQVLVYRSHRSATVPPDSKRHSQFRLRPFELIHSDTVEAHTHQLPFTPLPGMQLWRGCCRKAVIIPRADVADVTKLMSHREPLTAIAAALFPIWREFHGPAALVDLMPV